MSVVLCYNTLNEFAEVDKQYYFDNVFGKPVLERYMPFLFKGRIDVEQFIAKENYSEDMDEKLLGIARTIQWYKQNYATELKPYRIDLSHLNISGRQKKSFAHITDFLNLYSNDEHEFRNLVNDLLECYYAYMRMIKGNNLVSDYNKEEIPLRENLPDGVINAEVIEIGDDSGFSVSPLYPKSHPPQQEKGAEISSITDSQKSVVILPPLEFIKSKNVNGEMGIDEFLNNYDEDTLNRLLRRGDVYKPRANLIKALE